MRFRTYPIAIVGDVEKMYRQVLVHTDNRPLQRILWRTSSENPISTFELQTVTYGTSCAPYLATKTLQQIAQHNRSSYPECAESIEHNFYMDDWLAGGNSAADVIQKQKIVTKLLAASGFVLKKFASNSQEVLAEIPPEDLVVAQLHDLQDEQTVSTLGLVWDPMTDSLRFKVQISLPAVNLTKRKVMSYIAQIFDPLGLVGPTITIAKLFMQRLWALKIDDQICEWDTPLPTKLQDEWKAFHNTLFLLSEVRIPRFVSLTDAVNIQLHFFADASEDAYGSCCYVRAESNNQVFVQLLTSKAKVTPLSARHSIARLELCAAQVSSQLYKKVRAATKLSGPVFFWSDSTTVLHWLRSSPSRWKTFVANRVSQIQSTTDIESWRHVAGVDNPADDISRGLKPNDILHCKRWWNGPPWLSLAIENWPQSNFSTIESTAVSEEGRKVPIVALTAFEVNFCSDLFGLFENYSKLRRVTAFCLRYIHCLQKRMVLRRSNSRKYKPLAIRHVPIDSIEPLTTTELESAEIKLCSLAQSQDFAEEIADLTGAERVSQSSRLKWLSPFLDKDGILRLFPPKATACRPSTAACNNAPEVLDSGRSKLSEIRLPPLSHLFQEQAHTSPTEHSRFTDVSRVSPTRPFLVSGIDYCGPFFVKSEVRTRGPRKVYVAIFICFATRAVHIELVSDLSTSAFISSLRRFIGKRGKVAELHSDNATAFKGAQNALNRIYQRLKVDAKERDALFNWCAENQIKWKFIPPRSPHFSGLWEAAVKSAKTHMLKTMGSDPLAYEDMLTLLAQVEMCLNSRPLVPLPEDPNDLEVLTPGHFLIGESFQSLPEGDLKETPDNLLSHWELTQKKHQTIWSRWYPEYLQQLQARATKGCKAPVNIEIGRIVIIKEDNMAPANWPLGKIVKLHPGKDGVVRVVTIRTANKEVTRCVNKIALLPLAPVRESSNPSKKSR
ncbi:uncharacterized protein LOC129742404 [Uranotaenia lowii]|uniref:uncharacterized protein LOC129742404 n=1 Tax=Uranotaenia lowii TaxID=190385 RepID=UPI00247999A7|nr:uncharacterized protein LOC129742404 [Uranotaenia lowii]